MSLARNPWYVVAGKRKEGPPYLMVNVLCTFTSPNILTK